MSSEEKGEWVDWPTLHSKYFFETVKERIDELTDGGDIPPNYAAALLEKARLEGPFESHQEAALKAQEFYKNAVPIIRLHRILQQAEVGLIQMAGGFAEESETVERLFGKLPKVSPRLKLLETKLDDLVKEIGDIREEFELDPKQT
jgi:hypothetical protein